MGSTKEHRTSWGAKKSIGLNLGLKCSHLGFKTCNALGKTDLSGGLGVASC